MQIWVARFLAVAAIAGGALVAFGVLTFPGDLAQRENTRVSGLAFMAVGAFLLVFSLRREWFAYLDSAISFALIAVFAAGAGYSAFVLRDGQAALLHLLVMVFFIWGRIAQAGQPPASFRVSAGRFLFLMGRYFAAFVGGFGVAFLIVAPEAPAGYFLTAVGAGFLAMSYLAKRFLLGGNA